jgi:hypothetical protein
MPPKPRAPRKASAAKKPVTAARFEHVTEDGKHDGKTISDTLMPPPPDPLPPPFILETEMKALSTCLKVREASLLYLIWYQCFEY